MADRYHTVPPPDPRVVQIVLDVLCAECQVSRLDLMAPGRKQPLAWYRQIGMHLLAANCRSSRRQIAEAFGRDHHTTTRWAVLNVARLRSVLPGEDILITRLEAEVSRRLASAGLRCYQQHQEVA